MAPTASHAFVLGASIQLPRWAGVPLYPWTAFVTLASTAGVVLSPHLRTHLPLGLLGAASAVMLAIEDNPGVAFAGGAPRFDGGPAPPDLTLSLPPFLSLDPGLLAALWLPTALMACADTAAAQGHHVGRMFALSGAFLSLWVLAAEAALSPPVRSDPAARAGLALRPTPPLTLACAGRTASGRPGAEGRSLRRLRRPLLQRHPPRRQRPPPPPRARARHVRGGRAPRCCP